ncbi:MAG TPA: UDP-glucose 4-epimerase GalE [Polyangiaceae bacterium]|nr:UDP-glucose 4-epimerase GalE [Polyangiaceae bacterium]
MNVLVSGAAGYIGSHAIRRVRSAGHAVVALDDLSLGHREALPEGVPFVECDVGDRERVRAALVEHRIDCVMHFAAYINVGESVTEPLLYYRKNTTGTLGLLEAMQAAGVKRLVFSSTCATYGEPASMPIHEEMPQTPINPYGWSKLFSERIMRDLCHAVPDFGCIALRYFNVAGSAEDGSIGEDHHPETHLIPVILQAMSGVRDKISIFGDDYATPDGTCVRDYVHVEDLADAHVVAMERLRPGFAYYNVGIGHGHSVKEILLAAEDVVGKKAPAVVVPRRPGDAPELYADASKIERELGWRARRTDIRATIKSAWTWFQRRPHGYASARGNEP